MTALPRFFWDCLRAATRGSKAYAAFALSLLAVGAVGLRAYLIQLDRGLVVTGMTDQVSWGAYIVNFTYLVGLAAAAVMLTIPAYVFQREDAQRLVLIAEGVAVAACTMALLFVVADLGRPDRALFLVPLLGSLKLPSSMLAWDVLVVPSYLVLNLVIPGYTLFRRYLGRAVSERALLPWLVISMFLAIAVHTVTAFIFSADVARPFWHTALLGPRFLASAFCSGPAFLILVLHVLKRAAGLNVPDGAVRMLAVIVTVALQVNLVMLAADAFTELHFLTEHSLSAVYLFAGLDEHTRLVPFMRASIAMQLLAVSLLMIRPLRERTPTLLFACAATAIGVWIEKGLGLVIPGFVPTPLGEVVEYGPTSIELQVCAGVWALGALLFTVLAKVSMAIDRGELRARAA